MRFPKRFPKRLLRKVRGGSGPGCLTAPSSPRAQDDPAPQETEQPAGSEESLLATQMLANHAEASIDGPENGQGVAEEASSAIQAIAAPEPTKTEPEVEEEDLGTALERRLKWLDSERERLVTLTRADSAAKLSSATASFVASEGSKAGLWETASKDVSLEISLDIPETSDVTSNPATSFAQYAGVALIEAHGALVFNKFIHGPAGTQGKIEASGRAALGDRLKSLAGQPVPSLSALGAVLASLKGTGKQQVEIKLVRDMIVPPAATKAMSVKELLKHVEELELELKYARSDYARLDVGALDTLEEALKNSRAKISKMEGELSRLYAEDEYANVEDQDLVERFEAKSKECRMLSNQLADLKGAIRVFVRVRPHDVPASGKEPEHLVKIVGEKTIALTDFDKGHTPEKTWDFDSVFNTRASQSRVYKEVEPVVESVLDGHNVCVFAYGQTGSGKTYTMEGPDNNRGIYHRAVSTLFSAMAERNEHCLPGQSVSFSTSVQVLEIYKERIRDLLNPHLEQFVDAQRLAAVRRGGDPSDASTLQFEIPASVAPHSLEVAHDPDSGQVYVQDALELEVSSAEELQGAIDRAKRLRAVGATSRNVQSSRSHLFVLIKVQRSVFEEGESVPKCVSHSKLQLVDLAGSERATNISSSQRLKETGSINKSLAALGEVLHALQNDQARHVPFRNSKLTSLLRDSIGGQAKALMIMQVSPLRCYMHETLRTLEFAQRIAKIRLGLNRYSDGTDQFQRLKQESMDYAAELHSARFRVVELRDQLLAERRSRAALQLAKRHAETEHEAHLVALARQEATLRHELHIVRFAQRDAARREKDEQRARLEKEVQSAQNEALAVKGEVKVLVSRNADLRREILDLKKEIQALEKQVENRDKELERERGDELDMSKRAAMARFKLNRTGSSRSLASNENSPRNCPGSEPGVGNRRRALSAASQGSEGSRSGQGMSGGRAALQALPRNASRLNLSSMPSPILSEPISPTTPTSPYTPSTPLGPFTPQGARGANHNHNTAISM